MNPAFNQAAAAINKARRILFTTHERTDGDDLGSVLALARRAQQDGKQISIVITGGVPPSLRFLPGSELVHEQIAPATAASSAVIDVVRETVVAATASAVDIPRPKTPDQPPIDLIIISGCSQPERVGNPALIALKAPKLNIDHHPDNTLYGDINLVDPEKSSVAELVYDFFQYCRWKIDAAIATCLLTGIFTDTGSFMHSNTRESTLKAAAHLMKKGARIDTVTKHTYKGKAPNILKAWGKALGNAYYDSKQKIIYSIITEQDLKELGALPASAFEGLVETLNKVPEAKFALFLRQDGNVIKGSLRSEAHKGTNVSEIAHQFGGGGHKWASGFSVAGKLIKDAAGKWQVI